ncbi:MAG: hypothetical protein A4E57_03924 [Syntrophorhabdaceae bacterium PtaU1.Bin034]|nr:MAG: hypothetical protein A4E57_03924 [Syntrophorhabdaceae bacterium PtaU1.Bin034]
MQKPFQLVDRPLRSLARAGIIGPHIHLIGIIPLIGMMWADGEVQQRGIALLDYSTCEYIEQPAAKNNRVYRG